MTTKEALRYLEDIDEPTISPTQLAQVLGGLPYSYNRSAKEGKLTLPHFWRGRSLRIFVAPVIRILRGENP